MGHYKADMYLSEAEWEDRYNLRVGDKTPWICRNSNAKKVEKLMKKIKIKASKYNIKIKISDPDSVIEFNREDIALTDKQYSTFLQYAGDYLKIMIKNARIRE